MHGVAIVDGRGDIKAVIDPDVQTVAMMRREDIELGELFCQAPQMAERITQLTTDYAEIQQLRDAELSNIYQLRKALDKIFYTPVSVDRLSGEGEELQGIYDAAAVALAERPEQSIARVQAATLRQTANKYELLTIDSINVALLRADADAIEREAGL
jgi:hypothetical protein